MFDVEESLDLEDLRGEIWRLEKIIEGLEKEVQDKYFNKFGVYRPSVPRGPMPIPPPLKKP